MNIEYKKSNGLIKNLSWIFFGNILHSLLNFLLGIFVARELSLNDNGMLNYAASLITFLSGIATFGFNSTITREMAEHDENAGDYLCTCVLSRFGSGLIVIAVLQIIVRILSPGESALHLIVLCQSTTILFNALDVFVYWFRYKNQANVVAVLRLIAFGVSALWRVLALCFSHSLVLYACGCAAEMAFFGMFLSIAYFKNKPKTFRYSIRIFWEMLKGSYPFIMSAIMTSIYSQTDKIMLKSMLDNSAVALYSVSVHLAMAVSMIPSTLIEGFRPEIMINKGKNEELYQMRFRQLYAIVFWISIAYCLFVTVFSKYIMLILYGEKYLAGAGALALVVWYSTFSYFCAINNMYMVAEKKSKWVQVTTITGALSNVVLNFLLIRIWGIIGAALASLLTQFISGIVLMGVIAELRPGFILMLDGILLKDVGIERFVKRKV